MLRREKLQRNALHAILILGISSNLRANAQDSQPSPKLRKNQETAYWLLLAPDNCQWWEIVLTLRGTWAVLTRALFNFGHGLLSSVIKYRKGIGRCRIQPDIITLYYKRQVLG
jgi:hypothetical protein